MDRNTSTMSWKLSKHNVLLQNSSRSWSPTSVALNFVQEADALQMLGRGHRKGKHIADGFMESRVGPVTEGHRLIFVLQKVLDVAHLMVHCYQVIHGHNSTLFDPGDTDKTIITAKNRRTDEVTQSSKYLWAAFLAPHKDMSYSIGWILTMNSASCLWLLMILYVPVGASLCLLSVLSIYIVMMCSLQKTSQWGYPVE